MMVGRNILIFHLGALGDFVLTWPLALALSRLHPQSRVIYVTHAQKGELAERALGVESTDIELGWHHLYGEADRLPAAAGRMIGGAHSIYSFIAGSEDAWSQQVRAVAGEVDLMCLDPKPSGGAGHVTDGLLGQLASRPAVREAVRLMIRSINQQGLRGRKGGGGVVAIHPGSGSAEKCWPASSYLELARRVRGLGHSVRILIGEVEEARWPGSQIDAFGEFGEVHRPRRYVDLYERLAESGVYVGNDSGPTHLAGMLGLATVSIFGPSDAGVWRPLGPRVEVIQRMPMDRIEVREVLELVEVLLQ